MATQKVQVLSERELDARATYLEEREKELQEKQRTFDIRMKEQHDRFLKDKQAYEYNMAAKLEEVQNKEQEISGALATAKQALKDAQSNYSKDLEILQVSKNEIQKKLDDILAQNLQKDDQINKLESQIKNHQQTISKLVAHEEQYNKERQQDNQIDISQKRIEELEKDIQNLSVQLKENEKLFDEKKQQSDSQQKDLLFKLIEKDKQNTKLENENKEAQQKLQELIEELNIKNNLQEINIKLENEIQNLTNQLYEIKQSTEKQLQILNKQLEESKESQKNQKELEEIELKYKQLKKKQKFLKDQNEKQQLEIINQKEQIEKLEEKLNEKEENSKNDKEIENLESKVFELEDKLMKAHESVKGQMKEINQTRRSRERIERELSQVIEKQEEDFQKLRQAAGRIKNDKSDYEEICKDLKSKLRKQENQLKEADKFLQQKDDQLQMQQHQIDQNNKMTIDLQEKLKKTDLKLRQVTMFQLKDLQKKIKDKDQIIKNLNMQLQEFVQQRNQTPQSEYRNNKLTLLKNSSTRNIYDQRQTIDEVDSNFEKTNNYYAGTGEAFRIGSIDAILEGLDSLGSYSTPMKLPQIKANSYNGGSYSDYKR